jgi:hypothetical protein
MKKKALLVGALSPFKGPNVHLEEGEWLVEPPLFGRAAVFISDRGEESLDGLPVCIDGPCVIYGIAIEGEIHLSVKQVA